MDRFNGRTAAVCNGEHDLKVYFCEEEDGNHYFLGVCLRCGLTIELPVKTIEEIYNER